MANVKLKNKQGTPQTYSGVTEIKVPNADAGGGFITFMQGTRGAPIEIATAAGMDAVLIAANVGRVYKFTGTTDANYTNGDLYEVEEIDSLTVSWELASSSTGTLVSVTPSSLVFTDRTIKSFSIVANSNVSIQFDIETEYFDILVDEITVQQNTPAAGQKTITVPIQPKENLTGDITETLLIRANLSE